MSNSRLGVAMAMVEAQNEPFTMTIGQAIVMRDIVQDFVAQVTLDIHTPSEGMQEILHRAKAALSLSAKD